MPIGHDAPVSEEAPPTARSHPPVDSAPPSLRDSAPPLHGIPKPPHVPGADDDRRLRRAEERAQRASARADEAQRQTRELEQAVAERDEQLARIRSQHDSLRALTDIRAQRLRELEAREGQHELALRRHEQDLADERARHRAEIDELKLTHEAALATLRQTLESRHQVELDQLREALAETRRLAASAPPAADDLRKIYGIGPKYERILKEAGIDSYAQIAAWGDEDLVAAAKLLKTTPARIVKAGWVASARELLGADEAPASEAAVEQDTDAPTEPEVTSRAAATEREAGLDAEPHDPDADAQGRG